MATLEGRPSEVLQALATWELFRRLGFPSAAIDAGILNGQVIIQLSVQGRAPIVKAGRTQMTDEAFQAAWQDMAHAMADVPEHELAALWSTSIARVKEHEICVSLAALGVYWPNHPKYCQEPH